MAPRVGSCNWKRPYTAIYNDNYKYGTGLYSDTLGDIEKRYSESLSKTQLRSDRRDLNFATFADSTLTGSPSPGGVVDLSNSFARESPPLSRQKSVPASLDEMPRSSVFESRLNSAYHSSYAIDEEVQDAINSRRERLQKSLDRRAAVDQMPSPPSLSSRPKSLYEDAALYSSSKKTEKQSSEQDTVKTKRKFGGGDTSTNGPRASQWREKSRAIEEQVETFERNLSDCGNKVNNELSNLKSKCNNEISDLSKSVEKTTDQANELVKLCKRQQHQLLELQSAYEDSQRNIHDALEEMNLWQNRCKNLKKEMSKLREEVEIAITKTNRSS